MGKGCCDGKAFQPGYVSVTFITSSEPRERLPGTESCFSVSRFKQPLQHSPASSHRSSKLLDFPLTSKLSSSPLRHRHPLLLPSFSSLTEALMGRRSPPFLLRWQLWPPQVSPSRRSTTLALSGSERRLFRRWWENVESWMFPIRTALLRSGRGFGEGRVKEWESCEYEFARSFDGLDRC